MYETLALGQPLAIFNNIFVLAMRWRVVGRMAQGVSALIHIDMPIYPQPGCGNHRYRRLVQRHPVAAVIHSRIAVHQVAHMYTHVA